MKANSTMYILISINICLIFFIFFYLNDKNKPCNNPLDYKINPPIKPKTYYTTPLSHDKFININTRGPPTIFKQIGVLSGNNNKIVLPLFGKQTYRGSHKWFYYTKAARGHMYLDLPIKSNDSDCMDDYGCDELYDGDSVNIPVYDNMNFIVHIHKYKTRPFYNYHDF